MLFILLYQSLFFFIYPFFFLYFSAVLLLKGEKRRWSQLLLGLVGEKRKKIGGKCIWIHGVSGGEITLIKELIEIAPSQQLFHITTSNATGYQLLEKAYCHSPRISYSYHPLDLFFVIIPGLRAIKPQKFIVIEHDQWPLLLYTLKKFGVPRYLINIEFKPRDLKRYRQFPFVLKHLFNFTAFTYQNPRAKHLAASLGLEQIAPSLFAQNLKFLSIFQKFHPGGLAPRKSQKFFVGTKKRKLITLGSTHPPEEAELVPLLLPSPLERSKRQLCIIPRDPGRAPALMKYFSQKENVKRPYRCAYLSHLEQKNDPTVDLYIANTMGLSLDIYAGSDLVLIGDSFRPSQGGHNFLEPLVFGTPCIYGENLKIFPDIVSLFEKENLTHRAAYQVLPDLVAQLLIQSPSKKMIREKTRLILENNLPPTSALSKLF